MRRYLQVMMTRLPDVAPTADVHVFTPDWNVDLAPRHDRVHLVPLSGVPRGRGQRVIYQQVTLPAEVARVQLDAFLALATVLPLRLKVPTVLVVQFLQFYTFPAAFGPWRTWYLKRLLPQSVRRAQSVVVFTEFQRRELVKYVDCDAAKVAVIPHGIDNDALSAPADATALAAIRERTGNRPYVLYVSATYGYKNHRGLIDAFALLKRRSFPHVLLLLGAEEAVKIRDLAAHAATRGISGDVVFGGRVPSLAAAYQSAAAFAFPSLYETFGFPALEAMAAGCPVVASNLGATAELCGDAAVLADPANPEAFAAGLERVLTDGPLRQQLIERGRARAATFTWERSAADTFALLERAAHA